MIKNLIFGVVYLLISYFLLESLKANKNQQKHHSFYNTFLLKKSHSFYKSQLTQRYKKYTRILPQHSQKHLSGCCQKKHLHCTISRRPRTAFSKHLESKYLYFFKPLLGNICSQRCRELLSGMELNDFFRQFAKWDFVKYFKVFHFN